MGQVADAAGLDFERDIEPVLAAAARESGHEEKRITATLRRSFEKGRERPWTSLGGFGFNMRPDGLYYGDAKLSRYFEICGSARDARGSGWARVLRWADTAGQIQLEFVPERMLQGEASVLCAQLNDKKLNVTIEKQLRQLFMRYLSLEEHDTDPPRRR